MWCLMPNAEGRRQQVTSGNATRDLPVLAMQCQLPQQLPDIQGNVKEFHHTIR